MMKVARVGESFILTYKDGKRLNTLFKSKDMIDYLKGQGYKLTFVNINIQPSG